MQEVQLTPVERCSGLNSSIGSPRLHTPDISYMRCIVVRSVTIVASEQGCSCRKQSDSCKPDHFDTWRREGSTETSRNLENSYRDW